MSSNSRDVRGSHFWRWHLALPALGFVVVLTSIYGNGLDFAVADAFYDASRGRFPWRHAYLTKVVLHDWGDRLIIGLALAALLVWLGSFVRVSWRSYRRAAGQIVLSIVATVLLVAVVKAHSNVDCPWSLTRYGGDRPYVHLFDRRPPELPKAACFPGAHAAGAFSLAGAYFAARSLGISAAPWLLPPVAALGTVYAATQWARGAHFTSHDVWSAAIAWGVCLLIDLALGRPPRGSATSRSA